MNTRFTCALRPWALLGIVLLGLATAPHAYAFGGEDILLGRPWHHVNTTVRALAGDAALGAGVVPPGGPTYRPERGAGFSRDAAMNIAWHADYIDSYLYNPKWWAEGGPARTKAALRTFSDLAKLHFDDNASRFEVWDAWERYASGTLVGLQWASEQWRSAYARGDVARQDEAIAAAHHLLGLSLHAVQDFYSHSNWIDVPVRRDRTVLETASGDRADLQLYSGAYELLASQAPAHHGAYSLECSAVALIQDPLGLEQLCSGVSPFQNLGLCIQRRVCGTGRRVDSVALDLDQQIIVQHPPGIALDTSWLARFGGQSRGLLDDVGQLEDAQGWVLDEDDCNAIVNFDVSCDYESDLETCAPTSTSPRTCSDNPGGSRIFATAKRLAMRSSGSWVRFLGQNVRDRPFWTAVKSTNPHRNLGWRARIEARAENYEDPANAWFQFLSAGPYPSSNSSGTYLRVLLETGASRDAGTNADIVLVAYDSSGTALEVDEASAVLLDYQPTWDERSRTRNPLLVYDDFARRSRTVYTVGPYESPPASIVLENRAPSARDLVEQSVDDFVERVDDALTSARRTALGLIGGNADYVGSTQRTYRTSELRSRVGRFLEMRVDGGDEGVADIGFRVVELNPTEPDWTRWRFELERFELVRESKVDRLSMRDEPFFFMTFAPHNGRQDDVEGYWGGPYRRMDQGDTRTLGGRRRFVVEVPEGGTVAVAAQVWEHDNESKRDRRKLWNTFRTGFEDGANAANSNLALELAKLVEPEWTFTEIDVFGYERGAGAGTVGTVLRDSGKWTVGAGSATVKLDLDWQGATTLPAIGERLSQWQRQVLERLDVSTLPEDLVVQRRDAAVPLLRPPFQGTWSSSYGTLRLRQQGSRVYGDYADRGQIDGTFDPLSRRLTGTFTNGSWTGWIDLTLDGSAFAGTWGWLGSASVGTWSGTRSDNATPTLQSW